MTSPRPPSRLHSHPLPSARRLSLTSARPMKTRCKTRGWLHGAPLATLTAQMASPQLAPARRLCNHISCAPFCVRSARLSQLLSVSGDRSSVGSVHRRCARRCLGDSTLPPASVVLSTILPTIYAQFFAYAGACPACTSLSFPASPHSVESPVKPPHTQPPSCRDATLCAFLCLRVCALCVLFPPYGCLSLICVVFCPSRCRSCVCAESVCARCLLR